MDMKMTYKPKKSEEQKEAFQYDSLKLYYLKKLAMDCKTKGTRLVFAISSQYDTHNDDVYNPLKEICKEYQIPLINYYCDDEFVNNMDYFYDSVHMNRTGATKYTQKFVGELEKII